MHLARVEHGLSQIGEFLHHRRPGTTEKSADSLAWQSVKRLGHHHLQPEFAFDLRRQDLARSTAERHARSMEILATRCDLLQHPACGDRRYVSWRSGDQPGSRANHVPVRSRPRRRLSRRHVFSAGPDEPAVGRFTVLHKVVDFRRQRCCSCGLPDVRHTLVSQFLLDAAG